MTKFSNQIPSIYSILHKQFGVEWDKGVVITYGDTVYSKHTLPPDLIVHEETHVKQQESGAEAWWHQYLEDKEFRFKQEFEAYKNQAEFIRKHVTDRNKRFLMIDKLCRDLSGPMYGKMITFNEAKKILF